MSQNEDKGATNHPQGWSKLTEEQVERLRDVEWAIQEPEVIRRYGDQIVAVHRRQIIAHGYDEEAVLAQAERITGLPKHQIAIVMIPGDNLLEDVGDHSMDDLFAELPFDEVGSEHSSEGRVAMNERNPTTNSPPLPPGWSRLTEERVEVWRDMEWAIHDPEVQEKYPDEFVAVHRRQVVAHGHDLKTVIAEAERVTGLQRHQIAITTVLGPGILFDPR
jgi:hypothetical protein